MARYCERVHPLQSLRDLTREVTSLDRDFRILEVGPVKRISTIENELGSRVVVQGTARGAFVAYYVGAVFAEDFCSRLELRVTAQVELPRMIDLADALIQQHRIGLGLRRRRFFFSPPVGWHPIEHGLEVALYPPEYPLSTSCIWVGAAEPRTQAGGLRQALEEGDRRQGLHNENLTRIGSVAVNLPQGLSGEIFQTARRANVGPVVLRDLAILEDETYCYTVRLESLWHESLPAHREIFLQLLATIEPLPVASTQTEIAPMFIETPMVSMWGE